MEYDDEQEFWRDEPTQSLRRISAELPVRGSRSHTGVIPVVDVRSTESNGGRRPSRPGRGERRIDAFRSRKGLVLGALALLFPVALVVRSVDGTDDTARQVAVATDTDEASTSVPSSDAASAEPAPGLAPEALGTAAAAPASGLAPATSVDPGLEAPAVTVANQRAAATEEVTAELIAPETKTASTIPAKVSCKNTYTVKAGDYWLGIAQATGASIKDLLSANSATARTVLFAGRKLCLPAGAKAPSATTKAKTAATTPAAPATPAATAASAAPTTTAAPTPPPTAAPPTAAPTTSAPATTVRPAAPRPATTTTSTPAGPAPARGLYSRDQVAQIIRDVWPDDQEDKAIAIATRESNLQPEVRNHCCFGLFQIYYSVHKSWLTAMGITSAEMLYDPVNNAKAALALYTRAGGWGPWGG